MKTLKRIIYSFCVMLASGLMLWSCAKDYARTDITLEMTDEDSVDAIIDHDLLTVGGTIINIEEPQETHTPVVEYVDEVDITTPEIEEEDIAKPEPEIVQEKLEEEIEAISFIDEEKPVEEEKIVETEVPEVIKSVEIEETVVPEEPEVIAKPEEKAEPEVIAEPEEKVKPEVIAEPEETTIAEKTTEPEKIKEEEKPMELDEIFVSETLETKEVKKEAEKEIILPSDEEIEKLKKETTAPSLDVDELIKKPGTKKSLDEFVSPSYDKKRVKGSYRTHTVVRGDTLWSIGRKYSCSISRLCAENNISRKKVLRIGQTLIIPASKDKPVQQKVEPEPKISGDGELEMPPPVVEKPEEPKKEEKPEETKSSLVDTEYYTVQKGDSYWKIARKYGISSSELMSLNNTTSTLIRPGQKIKVPKK